jgi:hypothetical protein
MMEYGLACIFRGKMKGNGETSAVKEESACGERRREEEGRSKEQDHTKMQDRKLNSPISDRPPGHGEIEAV